jgi:hypothetical protein
VHFPGGNDIIVGLVLLEHQPHGLDIFGSIAPVAQGIKIAKIKAILQAAMNARDRHGDFTGNKGFTAAWGFVIEKNAIGGMQRIGFTVVASDPVGVQLGGGVGRTWVKRGGLSLRDFLDFTEHLRSRSLIEADRQSGIADGVKQTQDTDAIGVDGVLGHLKRDLYMRLGAEVVNFGWSNFSKSRLRLLESVKSP